MCLENYEKIHFFHFLILLGEFLFYNKKENIKTSFLYWKKINILE